MLTASKSTWEDLVNLALRFNDLETESTPVDKKGQADASVLFLLARDHCWWRGTASSRLRREKAEKTKNAIQQQEKYENLQSQLQGKHDQTIRHW
jgi:hypothetical protein